MTKEKRLPSLRKWKSLQSLSAEEHYAQGRRYIEEHSDYEKGAKHLKHAARKGDPKAQYNYGILLDQGMGVVKNRIEAFNYFELAASQGHARANYMLGCYAASDPSGLTVEQAAVYFKCAADKGVPEAQYNYAVCLLEGIGVKKCEKEAIPYLYKSALQGNKDAQYNLGICYHKGIGVLADKSDAIHYLNLAAKQGHSKALEAIRKISAGI